MSETFSVVKKLNLNSLACC